MAFIFCGSVGTHFEIKLTYYQIVCQIGLILYYTIKINML